MFGEVRSNARTPEQRRAVAAVVADGAGALEQALAQLPEDQRRAIVLYHLCDLSVADVATEVGAPTGTVKARLSRGRATLARLLNTDLEVRHA